MLTTTTLLEKYNFSYLNVKTESLSKHMAYTQITNLQP